MAASKGTGRPRSAGKKPTPKSSVKKTSAPSVGGASLESKRQIQAIVLFALGLFSIALTMIKGEAFWQVLHNIMFALFGWGALFFGVILIYIAVLMTMERPWQGRAILSGVTLAVFCGILQALSMGMPNAPKVLDQLVECVEAGVAGKSGGVAGIVLGLPLLHLFGKLGAGIILILLLVVMMMLLSGATLVSMARTARKSVTAMQKAYEEERIFREQKEQERRQMAEVSAAESKVRRTVDVPAPKEAPVSKQTAQKTIASPKDAQAQKLPSAGAVTPPPTSSGTPVVPPQTKKSNIQWMDVKGRVIDIPLDNEPVPQQSEPAAQQTESSHQQQKPPPVVKEKRNIDISLDDNFAPSDTGAFSLGSVVEPEFDTMEDEIPAPAENQPDPDLDALIRKALAQGDGSDMFSVPAESAAQTDALQDSALQLPPILEDDDDLQSIMASDPFFRSEPPDEQWTQNEEKVLDAAEHPDEDLVSEEPFSSEEELSAEMWEPEQELEQEPMPLPKPEYHKPPVSLLNEIPPKADVNTEEMKENAQLLVDTLASFNVHTRIVDIARGPAVTRYELQPSAGIKISRITGLADDIAMNLAAGGVRIEAPIPNKAAVGIEVPNKKISPVHFREIVESSAFTEAKSRLTVALGRDIAGQVVVGDIASMPHVLIAGSTGSGKSVCINSIIMSILFQATPEEVRLLMVDPKVVELGVYNGIPHLLVPVVTDPKKAAGALSWAVTEMLKRYKLFADNSVRDLKSYNALAERTEGMEKMPQVVIIIDELADLMMAAPNEIEDYICRLAQMARAAGMHLIIATQRPSVDVITGVIKANIPSRIAFAVSSSIDSRTILGDGGAEKLLGKGDMLFNPVGMSKPLRVQGCFVTDDEIERVISFIKEDSTADYNETIVEQIDSHVLAVKGKKGTSKEGGEPDGKEDELLMEAIEYIMQVGSASTSSLQRKLSVGYARAGRIMDQLESMGIVGPYDGAKPRKVLISHQQFAEMKQQRGQ